MKDLYIPNTLASLKALNALYRGIWPAFAELCALHKEFNRVKGECTGGKNHECPNEEKSKDLFYERERAYEVALIRLRSAAVDLYPLLQPLFDSATSLRRRVDSNGPLVDDSKHAVEAGCVTAAEDVYNTGCAIYFETRLHTPAAFQGIRRAYEVVRSDPREYVLMTSTHGRDLRFGIPGQNAPTPAPYMTLKEANASVEWWIAHAANSKPDAAVYHVTTGRRLRHGETNWVQIGEGDGLPERA